VRQFLAIKRNRAGTSGLLALEGMWAIGRAIAAGLPIEAVFVCPELLRGDAVVAPAGGVSLRVSEKVLLRMVERDGPDGWAAIARLASWSLDDVEVGERTCVVVADACDLAGNLGTIIRCADGAGAAAVLVTDRRVRINHPLVVKASMGTLFTTPVVDVARSDALVWLRRHGVRIVAADPAAAVSYRDAGYDGPVAIVVGSERHGLAPFWRDHADVAVSIPMLGVADSLNVGHAAALLLYESLASRTRRS
jgi:TrmH family RNA methyltransferase